MPFKLHHTLLYSSVLLLIADSSPGSPHPPDSSYKCYFIDGSFDAAGGPCMPPQTVGATMCCYSDEQCHEGSNLCLASPNGNVGQYDNGSSMWRRSCTDGTWQDPACLAIAYDVGVESVQLSICEDGTVCPRTSQDVNTTCCDKHQGQYPVLGHAPIPKSVVSSIRATGTSIASSAPYTDSSSSSIAPATASQTMASTTTSASNFAPVSRTPSAPTSTSPSAPTSTSPSAPTSTSPSAPTSTSPSASATGLGQPAKLGIGVSISFGTLIVALLSFIAFRLYKNSHSNFPNLKRAEKAAPKPKKLGKPNGNTGLQPRYELAGAEIPREMGTIHNTHELEAITGASKI